MLRFSPNLKMTNYTSERAFDVTSLNSLSATQSRGRRPYSGPTCTREDTAEGRIFPSLIKWQIQRDLTEWGLVEERQMYCHVRLCHVRAPRSDTWLKIQNKVGFNAKTGIDLKLQLGVGATNNSLCGDKCFGFSMVATQAFCPVIQLEAVSHS